VDPATFIRSALRWDEVAEAGHASMLRWYRDLIALRRETPALRSGDAAGIDARYESERRVLVYSNAGLVVACNLGVDVAGIAEARDAEPVICSGAACDSASALPPDSVAVWRRV
jgi:maltooligosyltrehalose trehalohydrolase